MSVRPTIDELLGRGVLLAPMAGVNDPIFRSLCARMGADLTYTEMVSAKGLSFGNQKSFDLLADETKQPVAAQLFGHEPDVLAKQACVLEERFDGNLALIDINMACPARKIVTKGDGAALLREPLLADTIMRAVVSAVDLPVTVKFRKGYELDEDIAVEFARRAQQCGMAALAIHGRTAQQFYHGSADRELIGRVVAAVEIPVIASGDVFTRDDIRFYREEQGARAVMVARGAQGNPWIFSAGSTLSTGKNPSDGVPDLGERVRIAREHTRGLATCYPRRLASMRKHTAWYFRGTPQAGALRRAVQTCVSLADYEALFSWILDEC
ncbi:MAG: tRNA-dihydrouridine synthase [Coriobacteriales bacterium]|jgi:nifR3 family TIM-barrel protein|nr:tRNA-dihydrouridine synthase [Coriobacteriales bacterium]